MSLSPCLSVVPHKRTKLSHDAYTVPRCRIRTATDGTIKQQVLHDEDMDFI